MLRSRNRKFWKGRSWSGNLEKVGLGVRDFISDSTTLDVEVLEWRPLISLVMVVQSHFCNQDFLIDHKFAMRLRSGEFPDQSITSNFASWKSSSLFQMKETGQYPIGIFLHHQEMPFSYVERLFSHQWICINSSYLNWHKWSYCGKTETSPEHLFGFLH